jgi:hypothetical protein
MKRLTFIVIVGLLAACGGQDSGTGTDLPSVDAARDAASDAGVDLAEAAEGASASAGQSARCLALVAEGALSQAIAVCSAALQANPADQQVQAALATARGDTGQLATAAADAAQSDAEEAASQAATDAAADAVGDALGN